MRFKIGMHVGPASEDPGAPGDYVGTSVDLAARLVNLGTADKILVSEVVASMIRDDEIPEITLYDHGPQEITGIGGRRVYEVLYGYIRPGPMAKPGSLKTNGNSADTTVRRSRFLRRSILIGCLALTMATLLMLPWNRPKENALRVVDSATHQQAARHFLLTLPGLNGDWWFDEIPWFSPDIRLQLLNHITVQQYLELRDLAAEPDVENFYRHLSQLCEASLHSNHNDTVIRRYELLRDLRPYDVKAETEESPLNAIEVQLTKELKLQKSLPDRAVLKHLLALLHWKTHASDAEDLLLQARVDYHQQNPELKALGIADSAVIARRLQRWRDAARQFESARAAIPNPSLSPLFNLHALVME
ncbi:MAG: hypothetical protein N2C12_07600, partial [Planctomycetales bacterium]